MALYAACGDSITVGYQDDLASELSGDTVVYGGWGGATAFSWGYNPPPLFGRKKVWPPSSPPAYDGVAILFGTNEIIDVAARLQNEYGWDLDIPAGEEGAIPRTEYLPETHAYTLEKYIGWQWAIANHAIQKGCPQMMTFLCTPIGFSLGAEDDDGFFAWLNENFERQRSLVLNLADQYSLPTIDLRFDPETQEDFMADAVHPNPAGQAVLAEKVAEALG